MKKLQFIFAIILVAITTTNAQVQKNTAKKTVISKPVTKKTVVQKKITAIKIKLTTDSGVIILRLYDSTPLHRDNFVKLVKAHFYDSLLFHRVIKEFMIQGGDPLSKNAPVGTMLGNGGTAMQKIPAEFRSTLFHKKGALAAARDGNPEKASSACQFYLVQGKKYTDNELNSMEMQLGRKFSIAQREAYKVTGGVPFLDMNYTVFGEVESGMDVIDKIANTPTGIANRPITDIRMKIQILSK